MDSDTDVLIVGAGPVGLGLAALLGRQGHSVLVVEGREAPTSRDESRAITWMPEGLLLADLLGVTDALGRISVTRTTHAFLRRPAGEVLLELRFDRLEHRHPYTLNLPQHDSETILSAAAIDTQRVRIERGWSVLGVASTDAGVKAMARDVNGEERSFTARFGVAADGARSTRDGVAAHLGVRSRFIDYGADTVVADLEFETEPGDPSRSWIALAPERPVGAFAFGPRRWRIVYRLNPGEDRERGTSASMVDGIAAQVFPDQTPVRRLWSSVFRLGQGQSAAYGAGRWALAGDAAHAMGPSAGAGMMVGLLGAWRLSRALTPEALRDESAFCVAVSRYEAEQRTVSKGIQAANRMTFRNIALRSRIVAPLRNEALGLLGHTGIPARMTARDALVGSAPPGD